MKNDIISISALRQSMANIFGLGPASDWADWLFTLGNFELILQVVLFFCLLLVGRYIYDLVTPFSLAEVLTTRDNKALSCSFACYLGGLCIVIAGVYSSASSSLPQELAYWHYLLYRLSDTFFWGAIGICLLILAQAINNRMILSHFNNYSQIIDRQNLSAGITEGASYLASGILLYAVMQGADDSFSVDILLTVFYFILGQLALVFYSRFFITIRQKHWNFHHEIEKQNIAAAIHFSFSFISFALLLAAYIALFDSIYGLLLAAVTAIIFVLLLHVLIDKFFFPKISLQQEISIDQNWGAALIEGFLLLDFCVVSVVAFSSYLA